MHLVTATLLAATFLVTSGAATPAPATPERAALEEEVRVVRQQLMDAARNRDRAAYEQLLADGFVFVHATGGIERRAEYIDAAVGGRQLFQRADREVLEESIHLHPGPTAITVTTALFRNRSDGSETRLRGTNTFVRVAGRWRWAAGHSTRLPNRPPAAEIDRALHYPRYVGQYQVGPDRTLAITIDGEKLAAVITGFRPAELVPRSPTHFIWFNPEMNVFSEILFEVGDDGKASAAVGRRDGIEVWRAQRTR